jgi:hypothetical protein
MSLFESASLVVTPNGTKASKLYAIKPTSGAGDLTVVRATTATRVNSAGLIESVAVNVPRLDYTNSTCPSILVEPQRSNLFTYSEDFTNVSWTAEVGNSITSNSTTSPDGNLTADTLTATAGNDINFYKGPFLLSGEHSFSIFLKNNGTNLIDLYVFKIGTGFASRGQINFSAETFTTSLGTGKIIKLINGWYKVTLSNNYTLGNYTFGLISSSNVGVRSAFIWGAGLEAGAYATSYIPTVASTVTRNADVISKTGISSLIGQTEGTVFVEHIYNTETTNNTGVDDIVIGFSNGTLNNLLLIIHYGSGGNPFNNKLRLYIRNAGADQTLIDLASTPSGTYKVAVAYKNNDIAFYVNGVQVGVDTSASIPTLSALYLYDFLSTGTKFNTDKVKSASLWKTRLTNAELAEITSL